jgi:predicted nucleotidyltransferase
MMTDLIKELKRLLENSYPEIEAAYVGGSVGRGSKDVYSDLDVFILVNSELLDDFLSKTVRKLADQLGRVVLFRGPVFVNNFGYSFSILFENSIILQFNINSRETLVPNYMYSQEHFMLFDRNGYYTRHIKNNTEMLNPTEVFWEAFTFFWFRSLNINNELKRGNLWTAICYMCNVRDQIVIMERAQKKNLNYKLNMNTPTKGINKELSASFNAFLSSTDCECHYQSIAIALSNCIDWVLDASLTYHKHYSSSQIDYMALKSIFMLASVLKDEIEQCR